MSQSETERPAGFPEPTPGENVPGAESTRQPASSSHKPRVLDLFCGAGGCSVGYVRAGFDVVGVDIEPQAHYPYEFIRAEALEYLEDPNDVLPEMFDAIHASPPCQAYSKAQRIQDNDHPDLIALTRAKLEQIGLPYVIENVPGAPLIDPIELCGTMFGLPLYRHRLFELHGFGCPEPLHGQHWLKQVKMGRKPRPNEIHQPVGNFSGAAAAREAMEMPWATRDEIAEAVPPAYTAYIGQYLLAHVQQEAKAA